jgi:3-oxoacyl-[acyl-carrier protein] reductase
LRSKVLLPNLRQRKSVSPGAVMTERRQAFFEKWAPAHNLTVEEAIKKFPERVGIAPIGKTRGNR